MAKRRGNNNRGFNKRPGFVSQEESRFFEKTPKHTLFDMLRLSCVMLASFEHEGYLDTWMDDPSVWMEQAKKMLGEGN